MDGLTNKKRLIKELIDIKSIRIRIKIYIHHYINRIEIDDMINKKIMKKRRDIINKFSVKICN